MILSTIDQGNTASQAAGAQPPAIAVLSPRQRDAQHIRDFLAGDESAFAKIMSLHRGRVFALAVAIVHNASDAEEVVQDTFIRAHRGLAAFRGESSLSTWLYHIATNLARNRYWYFHRRRRHETRSLEAPTGADSDATYCGLIADPAPDPAREAAQQEFTTLVGMCMGRLNPQQREILTFRNLNDLSYHDIGRRLGINIGTVKSRIARARRNLRIALAESYPWAAREQAVLTQWFETSRSAGLLAIASS